MISSPILSSLSLCNNCKRSLHITWIGSQRKLAGIDPINYNDNYTIGIFKASSSIA